MRNKKSNFALFCWFVFINLNGPGIDEYMIGKEPPYRGQNRGF